MYSCIACVDKNVIGDILFQMQEFIMIINHVKTFKWKTWYLHPVIYVYIIFKYRETEQV